MAVMEPEMSMGGIMGRKKTLQEMMQQETMQQYQPQAQLGQQSCMNPAETLYLQQSAAQQQYQPYQPYSGANLNQQALRPAEYGFLREPELADLDGGSGEASQGGVSVRSAQTAPPDPRHAPLLRAISRSGRPWRPVV
jgi:hypothetical protein